MGKKLKVTLPEGWSDETAFRGDGVLTLVRERSKSAGALQMSLGVYEGDKGAAPSGTDLVAMAIRYVGMQNLGRLDECSSGPCSGGNFGSTVFWSQKAPHSQLWFISNGLDLITVNHICQAEPDRTEVLEATLIAETVEIVEE